jgi:hypothetical protein
MVALDRWQRSGLDEDAQEAARLIRAGTTPGTWKRGSSTYAEMLALVLNAPHPAVIEAFAGHPWRWFHVDLNNINLGAARSPDALKSLIDAFRDQKLVVEANDLFHDHLSPLFSLADVASDFLGRVLQAPKDQLEQSIRTWKHLIAEILSEEDRGVLFSALPTPGETLPKRPGVQIKQIRWLADNLRAALSDRWPNPQMDLMVEILEQIAPTPGRVAQVLAVAALGPNSDGFDRPMETHSWNAWQRARADYSVLEDGWRSMERHLVRGAQRGQASLDRVAADVKAHGNEPKIRVIADEAQSIRKSLAPLGWPEEILERTALLDALDRRKMILPVGPENYWRTEPAQHSGDTSISTAWDVCVLDNLITAMDTERLDLARVRLLNHRWDRHNLRASPCGTDARTIPEYLCARGAPAMLDLVREDPDRWGTFWAKRPDFLLACVAQLPRRKLLEFIGIPALKDWRDEQGNTLAHSVLWAHGGKISVYLGAALRKHQCANLGVANHAGYTPLEIASLKGLPAADRAQLDLILLQQNSSGDEPTPKQRRKPRTPTRTRKM